MSSGGRFALGWIAALVIAVISIFYFTVDNRDFSNGVVVQHRLTGEMGIIITGYRYIGDDYYTVRTKDGETKEWYNGEIQLCEGLDGR